MYFWDLSFGLPNSIHVILEGGGWCWGSWSGIILLALHYRSWLRLKPYIWYFIVYCMLLLLSTNFHLFVLLIMQNYFILFIFYILDKGCGYLNIPRVVKILLSLTLICLNSFPTKNLNDCIRCNLNSVHIINVFIIFKCVH